MDVCMYVFMCMYVHVIDIHKVTPYVTTGRHERRLPQAPPGPHWRGLNTQHIRHLDFDWFTFVVMNATRLTPVMTQHGYRAM